MRSVIATNFWTMATPYWSRENHKIAPVAIATGFILTVVVNLAFFRGEASCLIPLAGILGAALVWFAGQKLSTPQISKWVALDLVDTHRLVTHVLQNKGLPFQDKGLRFRLEGSDLILHLDKGYLQGTHTQGTIITLTPLNPDNLPLTDSLRERIDEALKPRGLTP
jgi:hypothetical protein